MTTPAYRKSVAKLNALERSEKLSPDGKTYVIQTVDPFHDQDLDPVGVPDTYIARNVIQTVKQKMTISKSANLPAGPWDCNVFNLPWVDAQSLLSFNMYKNVLTGNSGNGFVLSQNVGGIIACQMPTGNPTSITQSASTGVQNDYGCIMVDREFLDGPCRVVSCGFEVTNTTSDLYRQGDVTVYRVPEPQRQRCDFSISSSAAAPYNARSIYFSGELHSKFPTYVGEAEYMVGSRTWAAADGCYIPLTLAGSDNPVRGTDSSSVVMRLGAPDAQGFISAAMTGAIDTTLSASIFNPAPCVTTPFNMGGAYFTGLSDQTTLTITAIWYIERFPTTLQKQIAVLADTPTNYDPLALELYDLMMRTMPVGVKVAENGLGDWFAEVVGSVSPVIEGLLGAIPHPYAQMGAQVARTAGKIADRYRVPPGEKGDAVAQALKAQRKKAKKAGKGMVKAHKGKKKGKAA